MHEGTEVIAIPNMRQSLQRPHLVGEDLSLFLKSNCKYANYNKICNINIVEHFTQQKLVDI